MKDKPALLLFLLLSLNLLGQHPNTEKFVYKRIDHKFDNYQTPEITDALFILNGDTIKYKWDKNSLYGLGYAIPKESMYLKNNIRITHTNYKSLVLDSVYLRWHKSLYLFQEGEEAYIENGMPIALNYGKKYIAVKVSNKNYTSEEAKQFVTQICKKYKLKMGVSYQDSIKKIIQLYGTSDKSFGGLESELDYIFWLEKEDNSMFDNQSKMYKKIRKKESIKWLGVPQEYYSYVLNDFEIEFKRGIDTLQINSLIKKYKLELISVYKSRRVSDYTVYSFKNKQLIPNDDLIKNLMKESIVKYVRPKKMIYETDC